MRIEPVNLDNLTYKKTLYNEIITEFINSDYKAVEIKDYNCKYAYNCTQGCNAAIKRMKISGIKASTSNNHVYLIKEKK